MCEFCIFCAWNVCLTIITYLRGPTIIIWSHALCQVHHPFKPNMILLKLFFIYSGSSKSTSPPSLLPPYTHYLWWKAKIWDEAEPSYRPVGENAWEALPIFWTMECVGKHTVLPGRVQTVNGIWMCWLADGRRFVKFAHYFVTYAILYMLFFRGISNLCCEVKVSKHVFPLRLLASGFKFFLFLFRFDLFACPV